MELGRKILCPLMDTLLKAATSRQEKKNLKEAYRRVRDAYSKENVGAADAIEYDNIAVKCAYLYLFGPSHSSMVFGFLWSFREGCSAFDSWFDAIMERGRMQVCALGGGPGFETILTYLWLETLIRQWNEKNDSEEKRSLSLELKTIDLNKGWSYVFSTLQRMVRKLLDPSCTEKLRGQFIQADLLADHTSETQNAIAESDFLLMVKFLSAIAKKDGCVPMLKRVMDQMKEGAVLFVVDGDHPINKKALRDATCGSSSLKMKTIFERTIVDFKVNSELYESWRSNYGPHFGGDRATPLSAHKRIFVQVLRKTGRMLQDMFVDGYGALAQSHKGGRVQMDVSYEELSGELWDGNVDSTSDNYENTTLLNEFVRQLPLRTSSSNCSVL